MRNLRTLISLLRKYAKVVRSAMTDPILRTSAIRKSKGERERERDSQRERESEKDRDRDRKSVV